MATVVKYMPSSDATEEEAVAGAVETAFAVAYDWSLPMLHDSVEAALADIAEQGETVAAVFRVTVERVDVPTPKYEGM